jgi:hypothetical protein
MTTTDTFHVCFIAVPERQEWVQFQKLMFIKTYTPPETWKVSIMTHAMTNMFKVSSASFARQFISYRGNIRTRLDIYSKLTPLILLHISRRYDMWRSR